ncbi:SET domain-containing protein [Mycena sanguinolenta]|uniref:SET domain-containing protein n=1 Tax=Mycena sanguinolenta TaxID=230812 RepID=A0A8H6ZIL0_9AGAR|nr:SET domain-containing protein [Mycena sanguinolenta]
MLKQSGETRVRVRDPEMSNASKQKRSKRKDKDDAKELWCPSPTPSEDWGSDAGVDFEFKIIGEEVGYKGKIKYEVNTALRRVNSASPYFQVLWHDWQRSDGTSTTWEDPADNAAIQNAVYDWDLERIANLSDNPDVELWGTTDIVNTRTRLRKQGYEEPTEEDMATFQADGDALVRRMEELMAESKEACPHLFLQDSSSRSKTHAPTTASRSQAQTGPSRVDVNAEAGPSRLGPAAAPARFSAQAPLTASSSRLPAKRPAISLPPPGVSPHRAGSPAISVSSSADSVELISTNPAPGGKRRAISPPKGASSPPPKRRGQPPLCEKSDKLRATSSASLLKPSSIASAEKSLPNTPRSSVPPLGKRKATSPPRAAHPPPPKLRAPRDDASASFSVIRATRSDKLRPTASAATAIVDSDDDDAAFRKCVCGTLLPPLDVYQPAVCDTCRSPAKREDIP